jgi:hypothetical protein
MYVEATAVIMRSYLDAFVAHGNSSRRANTSPLQSFIDGFFGRSVRLCTFVRFEQLGSSLMAHAARAPPPRTRARC